uniref:Tyrosine aminotransferase n=1 Tax=Strongyloides venezuelensis TaxID=75913 RepID=A0A0K0FPZ7_STRVS
MGKLEAPVLNATTCDKIIGEKGKNLPVPTPTQPDQLINRWAPLKPSTFAQNTVNPVRLFVEALAIQPNPKLTPIKLNLGDPTLIGNLPPPQVAIEGVQEALISGKFHGYGPSVGFPESRQAVVDAFNQPEAPITINDVILTSGCSHALQIAIESIANKGDNILVPKPGFPLYTTLMTPLGIEDRSYNLILGGTEKIDFNHMESIIDKRTKAIIINNPSNPIGIVLEENDLKKILEMAYKHRVVIIADEIYGDLTFNGAGFKNIATLTPKVPVISCDGIAKRYMVPGWRLGWIIIHDRFGVLEHVRKGMVSLTQKIVGPCALMQGALPKILKETPKNYFEESRKIIEDNTKVFFEGFNEIPGLTPIMSNGAMYMMVKIDPYIYGNDIEFLKDLIKEQSVYCLPGGAFGTPFWFRVVLTYPESLSKEAIKRIGEFCKNRRLKK